MKQEKMGLLILRLGMAGVYLYFGVSQLMDAPSWAGLVPDWAVTLSHMTPKMVVLGNGIFEIVLGTLLAIGILVRPLAAVLAIHLGIIASRFGTDPTGVRDYGLALATLSLAFLGKGR